MMAFYPNSVDLIVERQWHIGMHARSLAKIGALGTVFGGFPASRYLAQVISESHLRVFPGPALWNHGMSRLLGGRAPRLDEGRWLARSVLRQKALSRFVACYATAYRYVFPALHERGHVLILERGSTHPENYFHQIELARKEAGLPWSEELPEAVRSEIRASKLAHFVGAGSQMIADSYVQRGYLRERILLAPWCTDPEFFCFRERAKAADGMVRVVCVGMVGLRKGLGRLLRIARWAESRGLSVCIQVVGPLEKEAPALLAQAPSSVQWLGVRKGTALRDVLHAADIYILPSYEEGFGISILEAMSTGLPVVVSQETGGREAVRPGINGEIMRGFDENDLDEQLLPMIRNRDMRLALGREARLTVENGYSEAHYASKIASEYRRMFELTAQAPGGLSPAWQPASGAPQ